MKTLRYLVIGVLFVLACAPEQSDEVRRREDSVREYDRLNKAAGSYVGVLKKNNGATVPASVEIVVIKNPTDAGEKPILSVTLRVGLLGGVTITSTSASYDWGTAQVSAAFARKGGAFLTAAAGRANTSGVLELRGKIDDGRWADGRLVGPHFGDATLLLDRKGKDQFENFSEKRYRIVWETNQESESLATSLVVKRRNVAEESPSTSDLPYLPGLDASVVFEPFAKTPQSARKSYYDPLAGTFDLQFTDTSWIRLDGLALPTGNEAETTMRGWLTMGGNPVAGIRLEPVNDPKPIKTVPPLTYLGTYQGSSEAVAYKAIAYVDAQGSTGSNQPDLPFPTFPQMKLEVSVCNGDEIYKTNQFRLDILDYLNRKALFRRMDVDLSPLEIYFEKGWTFLDGTYLNSQGTTERPKLKLRPNVEVATKGCATVAPEGQK